MTLLLHVAAVEFLRNVTEGKYDAIIVDSSDPVVELANEASDGNANQECLDRISQLAEIEDLQPHRDPPLAPLFIKDSQDYFDSQQANALKTLGDTLVETRQMKCNVSTSEAYGSLRECISKIKIVGLSDLP
ncbi:hypothetical protein ACSBR2_037681 [Camellia fascicularis]